MTDVGGDPACWAHLFEDDDHSPASPAGTCHADPMTPTIRPGETAGWPLLSIVYRGE